MDLYISIEAEQVENQNGCENRAIVTVDMVQLWPEICRNYTHVHLELSISIPVMDHGDTEERSPIIVIQIAKDFAVADITECKVQMMASYCQEEDPSREASAKAYLTGYRMLESGRAEENG